MLCSFRNCKRQALCKKLCSGHYQQISANKELTPIKIRRVGRSLSAAKQQEIRVLAGLPILEGLTINISRAGYPYTYLPNANGKSVLNLIHRLVMAAHLGRALTKEETVHHGKLGKGNPHIANLTLFASNSEHRKIGHSTWGLYGFAKSNADKTHCSRGHLLAEPNLRKGTRQCRLCANMNQNRRNAEKRSANAKCKGSPRTVFPPS